jgi:hypothetical protein
MRGFGFGSTSLTNRAHQPRSATGASAPLSHRREVAATEIVAQSSHPMVERCPVAERSRSHHPKKTKIQYNQRLTNRSKARLSEPSLVRKNFNAEEM